MLVKGVLNDMRRDGGEWWMRTEKYMEWARIELEDLERISGQEVKRRIAERVESGWRRYMRGARCGCIESTRER